MIPKIIHYCWFGKGVMPASQRKLIQSWKNKMPGYQFKCWDESNFDVHCIPYVKNAYEHKKYAFVSDYARLKALYQEGGFYLDTDIELYKSLDEFRGSDLISGIEYFPDFEEFKQLLDENNLPKEKGTIIPYLGFLAAVIGCVQQNELIKDLIEFYDNIDKDSPDYNGIVIDGIVASMAIKYGFVYADRKQILNGNMMILPSRLFCSMPKEVTTESYLFHHCAQSWQPKTKNQKLQLQLDKLNLLTAYKKITGFKRAIILRLNK